MRCCRRDGYKRAIEVVRDDLCGIDDPSAADTDEFARFLLEQDAVLLRDDEAARAARVAAELIADAELRISELSATPDE